MQLLSGVEDLPRTSNVRTQSMALWVTAISMAIILVAYALYPGFWPPLSPQMSADAVAAFYRDNAGWIRFSMVTFNLCGIMLLPLFCVVTVQIKRMAAQSQAFAYCYLMATVSGATIFALSAIFFAAAAYRPDRDSDLVLVLNDLGWIVFVAPGRHGAGPEPHAGSGDLLRHRAEARLPAVGRPFRPGRRARDGTGGVLDSCHLGSVRVGRRNLVLAAEHRLRHLPGGDARRHLAGGPPAGRRRRA